MAAVSFEYFVSCLGINGGRKTLVKDMVIIEDG